jgi:hypothetical protein
MPYTTCIRRAPNRGPTLLVATTTLLGEHEAIDTIETPTSNANIDPALTNHDINPPPPPPPPPLLLLDYLDPNYDTYHPTNFEYPSPPPLSKS